MANQLLLSQGKKGLATGLNAGIGNLGVSLVQFAVPVAISAGMFGALGGEPQQAMVKGAATNIWLQNAGFIWVLPIALASLAAWFGMNDIADARASFADQAVIFKRKHNWLMCWLYVGTFGSFIGFSAGFAMLTKTLFPQVDPTAYAFLGPLVGSLTRPLGGWVSDKLGGARHAVHLRRHDRGGAWRDDVHAGERAGRRLQRLPGHVHRAVRADRRGQRLDLPHDPGDLPARAYPGRRGAGARPGASRRWPRPPRKSAAVLGFSGAIGAYGGFFIPRSFGTSLELTGGAQAALYCFIAFYATCVLITWWQYAPQRAGAVLSNDRGD